jgi:hypothetical protein
MPQLRVGYIRVTHPCAGRHQVLLPVLPLDLHVLGLPLAFILSQDQTLRCNLNFKCLIQFGVVYKYLIYLFFLLAFPLHNIFKEPFLFPLSIPSLLSLFLLPLKAAANVCLYFLSSKLFFLQIKVFF